jgi:hypothetical protein
VNADEGRAVGDSISVKFTAFCREILKAVEASNTFSLIQSFDQLSSFLKSSEIDMIESSAVYESIRDAVFSLRVYVARPSGIDRLRCQASAVAPASTDPCQVTRSGQEATGHVKVQNLCQATINVLMPRRAHRFIPLRTFAQSSTAFARAASLIFRQSSKDRSDDPMLVI